jgi:hypothetical protein
VLERVPFVIESGEVVERLRGSDQWPGLRLAGDDTNCSGTAAPGPNQVGTGANPIDPGLGALADNGGPTKTCALLATSPAGDAGNPSGCTDNAGVALATDQRGQPRTVDGKCDNIVTLPLRPLQRG